MVTGRIDPADRRRLRWTDEQLRAAIESSSTWTEAIGKLGMTAITNRAIKRRVEELGLDTSRFPTKASGMTPKYTEKALRAVVVDSLSLSQVARAFGSRPIGSVLAHIRRQVDRYGIDTSHFRRTSAGRQPPNRNTPERVFTILPEGSTRRAGDLLRRSLIEVGIPYRCAKCGNDGEWQGRPLTLDVDHISGEWLDNRQENLRFLCPNCHSQTDTWRSMNHRRQRANR